MKNLSVLIFVFAILLSSCSKEEQEIDISNTEDCLLEYVENIPVLESSLNEMSFYSEENSLLYKDNDGNIHRYNASHMDMAVHCYHKWVCETDPSYAENFWAERLIQKKELQSNTSDYDFSFSFSASLNEETPSTYADILGINVNVMDTYYCSDKYVINPRTDDTAANDEFVFYDEVSIEGNVFYDVYQSQKEDFEMLFNKQQGLLKFIDLNENKIFVLISE